GTSFTQQRRAFLEEPATSEGLRRVISRRTRDLISLLASPDVTERTLFARHVLLGLGYRFDTVEEQGRLEQHLYAEIDRVVAERQEYLLREEAALPADVGGQIVAQSKLFRDRGLSLDTSILPSFAIEQAL